MRNKRLNKKWIYKVAEFPQTSKSLRAPAESSGHLQTCTPDCWSDASHDLKKKHFSSCRTFKANKRCWFPNFSCSRLKFSLVPGAVSALNSVPHTAFYSSCSVLPAFITHSLFHSEFLQSSITFNVCNLIVFLLCLCVRAASPRVDNKDLKWGEQSVKQTAKTKSWLRGKKWESLTFDLCDWDWWLVWTEACRDSLCSHFPSWLVDPHFKLLTIFKEAPVFHLIN